MSQLKVWSRSQAVPSLELQGIWISICILEICDSSNWPKNDIIYGLLLKITRLTDN